MEKQKTRTKPFGITDRISYMFGDFGNDFTFILSSMFLMKFYTDVMGVSSGLVGLMMMVARIVDAFTDVANKIKMSHFSFSCSFLITIQASG